MKNDAFLHYSHGDWGRYGLAVPNFGIRKSSQNDNIRDLVDSIGRHLQNIMWHPDTRMSKPPSINTVIRVHQLCIRARSLLSARAVPSGTKNMEPAHAIPAPEEFRVYPVPYFHVKNRYLRRYASFALLAITEAMQHSENAQPLDISEEFAAMIGQYIQRIYTSVAVELLLVNKEEAHEPDFVLTDEVLKSYNPASYYTSTEMTDTVPNLYDWPTEDDLEPLTNGIYVSMLPPMGRYPGDGSAAPVTQGSASTGSSASRIVVPDNTGKFYPMR